MELLLVVSKYKTILMLNVFTDIYLKRKKMKTPSDLSKLIQIKRQQMALEKDSKKKNDIQKIIQKLELEKKLAALKQK